MSVALARIVVSVSDLDSSLAFYEGVLGFLITWRGDEVVRLRSGDLELMLHQREVQPSERAVAVSFSVDDVDSATDAAALVGAEILDPPEDQPWGERQSVLKDPDGHVVCLVRALPNQ